jgi:predicted nucleotidyltransferase
LREIICKLRREECAVFGWVQSPAPIREAADLRYGDHNAIRGYDRRLVCWVLCEGQGGSVYSARAPLTPVVDQYVSSVVSACSSPDRGVVSVVLFGSAATGSYTPGISDVDLLIVVADSATGKDKLSLRDTISQLEASSGAAKHYPYERGALDGIADRITANVRSFFVCTRGDLLSGDPARILDISAVQARFVDRVAVPSIVGSSVTIWGEDLLTQIRLLPIRRLDVAKAFFSLFNQLLFAAFAYPFTAGATKYAMEVLKRSTHNCYYCYHGRPAQLAEEVAFFQQRIGPHVALEQLMRLRTAYQPRFGFILRCFPTLVRLHGVTAWDNRFPPGPPRSIGPPGPER